MHRSPDAWRALSHAAINTALDEAEKLCGGSANDPINKNTTGVNENSASEEGSKGGPAVDGRGHLEASAISKKQTAAAAPSSILAAVLAGGESMLARLFSDVESVANVALDDPVRGFVILCDQSTLPLCMR